MGISGLDEKKALCDQGCHPFRLVTAFDDPEVRAQAEGSGCAGYHLETNSSADVLATIRRAVGLEDSGSLASLDQSLS